MKSHEALSRAIGPFTKLIATRVLHVSQELVYKWQEPTGGFFSGKRNPLDVIVRVVQSALQLGQTREDALAPLYYLAREFDHVLIEIPRKGTAEEHTAELLKAMKEIGEWSAAHSRALQDGQVSLAELSLIRKEGFEAACQIIACVKKAEESADE
jgi:hypothetical protein